MIRQAQGMNWVRKSTRLAVYARDGYRCAYCGVRCVPGNATLDHIVPRQHGGTNATTNLVTACLSCNASKGTCALELWARPAVVGRVLHLASLDLTPYRKTARALLREHHNWAGVMSALGGPDADRD